MPGPHNPFLDGIPNLEPSPAVHEVPDRALTGKLTYKGRPKGAALFSDKPKLNDVEQGASGQCFIDAALLAITYADPYLLTSMMRRKGTQISVTLHHRAQEDDELTPAEFCIDDTDFQPKFGRKFHYHAPWASRIIKAYGIYRAKFQSAAQSSLDFSAQVTNGGKPHLVFEALTGKKSQVLFIEHGENSFIPKQNDRDCTVFSMSNILTSALTLGKDFAIADLITEILSKIRDSEIPETLKNYILDQLQKKELDFIKFLTEARLWEQEKLEDFSVAIMTAAMDTKSSHDLIPPFLLTIFREIGSDPEAYELPKKPKISEKNYTHAQELLFSSLETELRSGKFLVASTKQIISQTKAKKHANESEADGLVGGHAYAVLGTCRRRDQFGIERHFVRLKNPWQYYSLEYSADGSRKVSADTKGAATREYEQSRIFGEKIYSSSDFTDPHISALNGSSNGMFEMELSDFCCHFSRIAIGESKQQTTKLLHDLQMFLEIHLKYLAGSLFRKKVKDCLDLYDSEILWREPKHILYAICNSLANFKLTRNSRLVEKNFADFCANLRKIDAQDENYFTVVSQLIKEHMLICHEAYGYREKALFEKMSATQLPRKMKLKLNLIIKSGDDEKDKIVQAYYYLKMQLNSKHSHRTIEKIHVLMHDIRQHWKLNLHESTQQSDKLRDFYSYLVEITHPNAESDSVLPNYPKEDLAKIAALKQAAEKSPILQKAKQKAFTIAVTVFAALLVSVGLILQFTGFGSPVGLLLIKMGYTKLAAAHAAYIASLSATISAGISYALGKISQTTKKIFNFFKKTKTQKSATAKKDSDLEASVSSGSTSVSSKTQVASSASSLWNSRKRPLQAIEEEGPAPISDSPERSLSR